MELNDNLLSLEPRSLWVISPAHSHPRPSGHEAAALDYVAKVGESLGHEVIRDGGNVIIRVKATPGYEDRKPVILQGHVDMVLLKKMTASSTIS